MFSSKTCKYSNDRSDLAGYQGTLGAVSIRKTVLPGMAIPMLKIRRLTAVLSLTWKSPYVDKTVFILRRGRLYRWFNAQMQCLQSYTKPPMYLLWIFPRRSGTIGIVVFISSFGSWDLFDVENFTCIKNHTHWWSLLYRSPSPLNIIIGPQFRYFSMDVACKEAWPSFRKVYHSLIWFTNDYSYKSYQSKVSKSISHHFQSDK